ncbi:MAG TPA: condensation domain-containing protein, partial [Thermoanaerobaculia bacterium]|nr:condensation domain-containing protein [Thermoanaerobaculia bacterium]
MTVDRIAGAAARELTPKQRRLFELLRGEGEKAPPAEPAAAPGGPIPRRGPDEPAVPSFGQRRLWFIEQLQPGSPAYHVPGAVRMRGALDLAALGRSLRGVTAHQESLRTAFRDDGGEPALEIAAPATARP